MESDISALQTGYSRRKAVINIVDNTAVPPTEVTNDRYILDFTAGTINAAWDGAAKGDIVEFNGTSWVATTPLEGYVAYVDTENKDAIYVDDGTPAWQLRSVATTNHGDLTLDDGTNPHGTTKSDVGLGNVPNGSVGDVGETEVAFQESQIASTIFSLNASARAAEVIVSIYVDATSDVASVHKVSAISDGTNWYGAVQRVGTDDVLVDVTSAGAIVYTSTTYAGFVGANSKIKYRVISTTI